ncbi:hypothetical protein IC615_25060 [Serratia ureilytica]
MAATFAGRMAERWGEALATPHEGITHVFPTAERVAQLQPEELRPLGVQVKRAAALIEIARALGKDGCSSTTCWISNRASRR